MAISAATGHGITATGQSITATGHGIAVTGRRRPTVVGPATRTGVEVGLRTRGV